MVALQINVIDVQMKANTGASMTLISKSYVLMTRYRIHILLPPLQSIGSKIWTCTGDD